MEPNSIPTSFIPKRPVTSEPLAPVHNNRSVGLLSVIAFIVVFGTAAAYGGTYLYQKSLTSQKVKLEQQIDAARGNIGTEFLTDMKKLNARISGVRDLLQKHIVVSPIFQALQETTLRSVQYRTFTYEFTTDSVSKSPIVKVLLDGTARNYSTIALQSDAFSQNSLIKNPVFSNLTVDEKGTSINFKLSFEVNPADLSFQTFIDSRSKSVSQNP